jgi:hypothetical protein
MWIPGQLPQNLVFLLTITRLSKNVPRKRKPRAAGRKRTKKLADGAIADRGSKEHE